MSCSVYSQLLWLCLAALSFSLAKAANDTCPLDWIFIDIHYRAVDARPDTLSYGLFIGAGVGSQNQSLWPAISYNETRLASNDFCTDNSPANCHDPKYTHGHFGADSSTSFQQVMQYATLDVDNPDDKLMNVTYGTDTLNLFTHFIDPSPPFKTPVENHPITSMSGYNSDADIFFHSGSVGLGPSSTLTKQLIDSGKISRNVVGLYLGTAYPRAGGMLNGSIVLGGYDAGRVDGVPHGYPLVTSPARSASPFKVHVKQMSLVTKDGSMIGLVTDNGFDGYISSSQYAMEFPDDVTSVLAKALAASPSGGPENVLQLGKPFDGNFTITLDDGYNVTYPSEWISNVSNITPFSAASINASKTDNSTKLFVFGAAFLHHLYMTVDYDAGKFFLANAKLENNYVMPQSLCPDQLPAAIPTPKLSKFARTGMIGAILGGVIGGTAIAWFAVFLIRKHLQHKVAKDRIRKMETGGAPVLKSSLRTRTKRGFVRFAKHMGGKGSGNTKRVSFTDSDSSSETGDKISVMDKRLGDGKAGIQMTNIKSRSRTNSTPSQTSNISDADTTEEPSEPGKHRNSSQPQGHVHRTTVEFPIPTPNRIDNPFASPMYTPATGNPLLADQRGFTMYDDDDDSDIEPPHRRTHTRTPSEQMRRNEMGLKIDTAVKSGRRAQEVGLRKSLTTWPKPKPKPLSLGVSAQMSAGPGRRTKPALKTKTEADYVKTNPVRALFGRAGGGSGPGPAPGMSRPSALRKIFPPPGE